MCGAGGGAFSSVITKTAEPYKGFKTGDIIALSFDKCQFGTSPLTLSGNATVIIRCNYVSLPTNFAINYEESITRFGFVRASSKFTSTGSQVYRSTPVLGWQLLTCPP